MNEKLSLHTAPEGVSSHGTLIRALDGSRLSKAYSPGKEPAKQPARCAARSLPMDSLDDVKAVLDATEGDCTVAVVLGDTGIREPFQFISEKRLDETFGADSKYQALRQQGESKRIGYTDANGTQVVQRTMKTMAFSRITYGDIDKIPSDISPETVVRALRHIYPELGNVRLLVQPSSSSYIHRDGVPIADTYGLHFYFECATPALLKLFFQMRKAEFDGLDMGILDTSVFGQSNRINYGSPQLGGGLAQPRRETWFSEGPETVFTVEPEWLPVAPTMERLNIARTLTEVVPEKRQGEAVETVKAHIDALLARLQHVREGGRYEAWRDLCYFVGGLQASGWLPMADAEIHDWFMGAVKSWPEWADKSLSELATHLRTGLEKGALQPCVPQVVVRKYAWWLLEAGVTPEQLGVRQSLAEYPLYNPLPGEQVHRFDKGFMTLPEGAEQAIQAALAQGRPVTVLLRGPMGCGKTEVARKLRGRDADFTLVTPSVSLATTGAARMELVCY